MHNPELPDNPEDLAFGQYIENDEGIWQVIGHEEESGLPIIRKQDPEDVPDYQTELTGEDVFQDA